MATTNALFDFKISYSDIKSEEADLVFNRRQISPEKIDALFKVHLEKGNIFTRSSIFQSRMRPIFFNSLEEVILVFSRLVDILSC